MEVKSISVQQLKEMRDKGEVHQLIDVREHNEFDLVNIQGELIPLGEVPQRFEEIATDRKVVVHCRSGKRSADAIRWLQAQKGMENLYNLEGGIKAWAEEIDPSLPTY